MAQNDYENYMRRSTAVDPRWATQNMCHVDNALAINVRGALIKSYDRLFEQRFGVKPNAFIVTCDLIHCLWEAGYIERDYRTDRMLFEGIPIYTTSEPNVMMAVIKEEVSDD